MGDNPLSAATQDEKIVKLNSKARMSKYKVDTSLIKEMQSYVIFALPNRKAFEPNSAEDLRQLITEMEMVQAYRDRITGITLTGKAISDDLDILIKAGIAYLYAQYSQEMKTCSNKETREGSVRYVLEPVMRRKEQWKSLLSIAEMARTNLNETYFALREIGENGRRILDARNVKRSFDT